MRAESVHDIITALPEGEKVHLFEMLDKPLKIEKSTDWIHEWKGLSEYLDGVSIRTLQRYHKEGIIKKYRLGKKVMFKKSEVDKAPVQV